MNLFCNKEVRDRFLNHLEAALEEDRRVPTELLETFERVIESAKKEFYGLPMSSHFLREMGAFCTEAMAKAMPTVKGHIYLRVEISDRGADVVPHAQTEYGRNLLEKAAAIAASGSARAAFR